MLRGGEAEERPQTDVAGADISLLLQIVSSDLGGRGVSLLSRPSHWLRALQLCLTAERIALITGFMIESAGVPETDGPLGTVVLGRALSRIGKNVSLITDAGCFSVLKACSQSVEGPETLCLDIPDLTFFEGVDLLIYLERPGKARDGHYYNMKGKDVSSVVVPLDELAGRFIEQGRAVLGIGDGGNEAGMGFFEGELKRLLKDYSGCLSSVPATLCLAVDVSNWGGYALSALLSLRAGRWVGPMPSEIELMLNTCLEQGAVDGVHGVSRPSVDGFDLAFLKTLVRRIKRWYEGEAAHERRTEV